MELEKIFANNLSEKRPISKIYKDSYNFRKKNNLKNGQET